MSLKSSHVKLPGIGIIGTGVAVRCLVPVLKSCGFSIEALWGQNVECAAECAKDLGISFFTAKVDEVLLHKDVDLVFIHCPPHQQSPVAVKALGIGKNVVCGTPSGPSQVEVLKMVHAADYYPTLMSLVAYGLRFLPCFVKMRQYILDGYIGEITVCEARVHCGSLLRDSFDWSCDELMGGGVLNLHGSAVIDLLSFLTNQRATRVHGLVRTFTKQTDKIKGIRNITSDDFCSFEMDLSGNSCATVTINSHASTAYHQEVLICGSKGRLQVRGSDLFGMRLDQQKEETLHRDESNILDQQHSILSSTGSSSNNSSSSCSAAVRSEMPVAHMKGLIKLLDSIKEAFKLVEEKHCWARDPVTLAATFSDLQYVQTVVDAVRKSSKTREWVKVVMMTEKPDPTPYITAAVRRSTYSLIT